MKAVVKQPGLPAIEVDMGLELDDLQATVGGYIEHVDLGSGLDLWLNEEGKLQDPPLSPNLYLPFLRDVIVGPVVVTSHDAAGETLPLTDLQVAVALRLLRQWALPR